MTPSLTCSPEGRNQVPQLAGGQGVCALGQGYLLGQGGQGEAQHVAQLRGAKVLAASSVMGGTGTGGG